MLPTFKYTVRGHSLITLAAICNVYCACAAENAPEMRRKIGTHQFLAPENLLHQNQSRIEGAIVVNRQWGYVQKKPDNLLAGTAPKAPAV